MPMFDVGQLGGSSVIGGAIANTREVVNAMAPGFRRCYKEGLHEDPNMKGSVRVTAKVGPRGDVLSATPARASTLSKSVISCVASRVAAAQFSPPEGGGATIIIPVSFFPQ